MSVYREAGCGGLAQQASGQKADRPELTFVLVIQCFIYNANGKEGMA